MIPLMKYAFVNEYETRHALAEFILKAPKFSMDQQCYNFEKKFSKYQGSKEAVLFNSGGSANLAILQSLKNLGMLDVGDNIGFSALTWSTNVMPIIQLGFNPIPIDCSVNTLNVMSSNLLELIERVKIKCLFITNVLGFTGDLDKIREICLSRNIILLEDNCEALGTELFNGKAGNFSLASSFSFFVAHHMSTIEGGLVVTNNYEIAEMLRIVRANGWDRNLNAAQQLKWRKKFNVSNEFEAKYTFYDLGYNLRPTEITGFIGQFQMQFLEKNIDQRESNFLRLEQYVKENEDLIFLDHTHIKKFSSFALPVLCKNKKLRESYFNQFSGAGVEIRPMIAGNIQKQPFFKKYSKVEYNLPGADFIHDCGFYCGNYPELSENDIQVLRSCLSKY